MERDDVKILSAQVSNFASYKNLEFNFDDQGLCLIQGTTGSGKSTLCDVIPWLLFGVTAKDGAADEVLPWNAEGSTEGYVLIELNSTIVQVHRSRKPNDLYYITYDEYAHGQDTRGKDLNDTQKQINQLLGFDADIYLSGAYFHEFSKTANFFTANAKIRRTICEQIVDLTLAKNLQTKTVDSKKQVKKSLDELDKSIAIARSNLEALKSNLIRARVDGASYETDKIAESNRLSALSDTFETDKKKLIDKFLKHSITHSTQSIRDLATIEATLEQQLVLYTKTKDTLQALNSKAVETCLECGNPKEKHLLNEITEQNYLFTDIMKNIKRLKQDKGTLLNAPNPYAEQLTNAENLLNTYNEQIVALHKKTNPHAANIVRTEQEIDSKQSKLDYLNNDLIKLNIELSDLDLLSEVTDTFRASLITNTIGFIQDETNNLLSNHFDAEIKVLFSATTADKLDTIIFKDGNECSYTQLSKGQRQLLKLCFGVSIMKAASNHSGITFNSLFFDEALSGLDDSLKRKSFSMFETLATQYSSVFVIDHNNDFKSLFSKKYAVELTNEGSVINEETGDS